MTEETIDYEKEAFSGSSLDTVEVPDDDLVILEDMANPSSQDEEQEAAEKEEKASKESDEQQEEKEEKEELSEEEKAKQHKRDLYKTPRNKLVREWHEAHEQAAAQKAKNEILEQELAELKKGQEEKNDPLKALNEQRQQLNDEMQAASDDADLEAYNTARLKLDEVNDQIMEMRFNKPAVKEDPAELEQSEQQVDRGVHPAAQDWLDRNEWFFNPKNNHLADYAEMKERELLQEGMKRGQKLYEKLDEVLSAVPGYEEVMGKPAGQEEGIDDGEDGGEERPTKQQGKPKHLTPPSRGGDGPSKPKPGELTAHDLRAMKMANLDPKNEQHKAAYLKRRVR